MWFATAKFTADGELYAKWLEYSHSLVQFQGGNPFFFSPDQYDQWLTTTAAVGLLLIAEYQ
jgi:hypothetical protein